MAQQAYLDFVQKFKPKKTTDDCYTPPAVYECVKNWAVNEYGLHGREIVRPFFPGGDFESYKYPDGCIVLDNPPFSILSKIYRFFTNRNIDYFLFCQSKTSFQNINRGNIVFTAVNITYENGAVVDTSFMTNLGDYVIRTAPELKRSIEELKPRVNLPQYIYPHGVLSFTAMKKIQNEPFAVKRNEISQRIQQLDSMRIYKKKIYGGGVLCSNSSATRYAQAQAHAQQIKNIIPFELSHQEQKIIERLSAED